MKKEIINILLIIFFLNGCATVRSVERGYAKINYEDGISKKEAKLIAFKHVIDNEISDKILGINVARHFSGKKYPNTWVSKFESHPMDLVWQGTHWYAVYVDKVTGKIVAAEWGPTDKLF
ncbi:MAG: hypothetical protein H6755_03445 [Candidatus Omnitrophica bacterium]|nr:hypothetical protein [Candidatus Omnitrophota bacterium]